MRSASDPSATCSNRGAITASIMLATFMQGVDTTIANVALPHMQGSFSCSQDQIAWVVTSYIVAAAIMTPLTGWLAGRFGSVVHRRRGDHDAAHRLARRPVRHQIRIP